MFGDVSSINSNFSLFQSRLLGNFVALSYRHKKARVISQLTVQIWSNSKLPSGNFAGDERREGGIIYETSKVAPN